jgi:hypothetical protein
LSSTAQSSGSQPIVDVYLRRFSQTFYIGDNMARGDIASLNVVQQRFHSITMNAEAIGTGCERPP